MSYTKKDVAWVVAIGAGFWFGVLVVFPAVMRLGIAIVTP